MFYIVYESGFTEELVGVSEGHVANMAQNYPTLHFYFKEI